LQRIRKGKKLLDKKTIYLITAITIFLLLSSATLFASAKQPNADPTLNNTFSIMQISDTQFLAKSFPQLFVDTTNWIASHASEYNVKMVIHTGDIVDNFGPTSAQPNVPNVEDPAQWVNANNAMSVLLNANIPYCWDAGNHDQMPWDSPTSTWSATNYAAFDLATMRAKPYWVSDYSNGKNTAVMFSVNGYRFLIINLEYKANDVTINWMKNLLDTNLDCNVIVAAHSYLNSTGGCGVKIGLLNDRTWCNNLKALIDGYPNVFLTLNGHDPTGYAYQQMTGNREEIYFNRGNIGTGAPAAAVRIYTFNLETMQVNTKTYSLDTTPPAYRNPTTPTTKSNVFSFNVNLKQVINPTDSWITGGGWIIDSSNHANLAINAKCNSDGITKGNMLYHYTANGYEWTIKTNTWTGFYIASDNSYAVLQGKADIKKTDSTGEVVWSASNYQITVELTDGSTDSVHLRILDSAGGLFWDAGTGDTGVLRGGQLTIHN
jgi:hypothetical protein